MNRNFWIRLAVFVIAIASASSTIPITALLMKTEPGVLNTTAIIWIFVVHTLCVTILAAHWVTEVRD